MNFVKISYTGRTSDGKVFATTDAEVAKKEGIYDENIVYKPAILIYEEKDDKITEKIKEEIKDEKVGCEKEILIPKEINQPYNPKLVKIYPLHLFKKQNLNPFPGMLFKSEGMIGKVISVAGGRVKVDFNSDIAGKELLYKVKIEGIAETKEEKFNYLLERDFGTSEKFLIQWEDNKVSIEIPKNIFIDELILRKKSVFVNDASKYLNVKEVIFIERWSV